MNSERTAPSDFPALDKRAQAAAWLARLRGPQRSAAVERGLRQWLRADAEHARAFELLTARLEVAERLRGQPLPRRWRGYAHRNSFRWPSTITGIAAALGVVMLGMFFYLRNAGVGTEVGEQRMLTLADNSRVYLNTDTRVVVRFDERSRTVELMRGEALFEVAKHAKLPFVVVAGERKVRALGTAFVVRRDSEKTAVTLIEGKVAVSLPEPSSSTTSPLPNSEEILSPGQRLTFVEQKAPQVDQPSVAKVTAWRQGQVALDNMSLAEAMVEMNRYSVVKLVAESSEAAGVRVGGFFRMGDSASFARAVAATYGFEIIERPNEIVIAGPPKQDPKQR